MKFLFNGIKINKTLTKGWFSFDSIKNDITFYPNGYEPLPEEVRQEFRVRNDSDVCYTEKDRFTITRDHKKMGRIS